MTRHSSRRAPRLWLALTLAIVAAVCAPLLQAPAPAQAAYGAMIQPVNGQVTGVLSNRCGFTDGNHLGIDIVRNNGQSIKAAYSGRVTQSGWNYGYGYSAIIEHPAGYRTLYSHLRSAPTVGVGATVSTGQVIGYVGSTGNTTAPHLHFEVWRYGTNLGAQIGYSCNQQVTQGSRIPYSFPGLGNSEADYNRDGISDVLGVTTTGALYSYRGTGNGTVLNGVAVGNGWQTMRELTRADFNRDGIADALGVTNDGNFNFYAGRGDLSFATGRKVGNGWQSMKLVESGADFSGDGVPDVVAVGNDGYLRMYGGDGRGGFAPVSKTFGPGWGAMRFVVLGDFTGDGRGDIAAVLTNGNLYLYRGTGVFTITEGQFIGPGWNSMTALTGGVDYNADGQVDLLARSTDGRLTIYPGAQDGRFRAPYGIGVGWTGMQRIE